MTRGFAVLYREETDISLNEFVSPQLGQYLIDTSSQGAQHPPASPECSGRLISLWDIMQKIWLSDGVSAGVILEQHAELCRQLGAAQIPPGGERVRVPPNRIIDRNILVANVGQVRKFCADASLNGSQ